MITNDELLKLLIILRENGVAKFSHKTLLIELHPQAYLKSPMIDNTITEKQENPRKREEEDLYWSTRFGGSSESHT